MAEMNGASHTVVSVVAGSTFMFTMYHCFMFDGARCLVPSRRDWHRCILVWMLAFSSLGLFVWAACWAYVKYQLGWIWLGTALGARPWPSVLFPKPYDQYNMPLTIILSITYSVQASLNAEEGLYWYHLMRSVRSPHLAKPWIGSPPFYAWIVISFLVLAIQVGLPWAYYDPHALQVQLCVELAVGGILELIVVAAATVVVLKFPAFLQHVKASGAGPDVLGRLHFYHEANKVRTFFRYIFSTNLLIIGADGLSAKMPIAWTPMASDLFVCSLSLSFCFVLIVSVIVYLPRTYGPKSGGATVMVGHRSPADRAFPADADGVRSPSRRTKPSSSTNPFRRSASRLSMAMATSNPAATGPHASQFALMSLLREGGQWEGEEDILRDVHGPGPNSPLSPMTPRGTLADLERGEPRVSERSRSHSRAGVQSGSGGGGPAGHERSRSRNGSQASGKGSRPNERDAENGDNEWLERPALPAALRNFTSPIAPHVEPKNQGPVEIRIRVEQEVHQDR